MIRRAIAYLAALAVVLAVPGAPALTEPTALAATTAPTNADGFTAMFEAKQDQVWSGGDQMTTVTAAGFTYWLTGDLMTSTGEDPDGSYPDGAAMVSNRMLMQSGDQLTNAIAGGGVAVPDPATRTDANQERYWPMAAFPANGFLYVLCQRVVADPDPSMPFKLTGVEMAKFTIGADGLLTLKAMIATPSTGVDGGVGAAAIQWAGDAIVSGGYVYVYGYTLASGNPYIPHYTYAARVPVGKVETPSAWRYWARSSGQWVSRLSQLNPEPSNQPDALIPSQVSSARIIGGKVVLLHKPWAGWGSTVYAEVSTSPVGPFTQKALFDSPAGTWEGRNYQTYGPMLHPEQSLASGRVLVSIDWNGQTMADVMGNADLYKPRFYEVSLP